MRSKKLKLVRDSLTMPETELVVLGDLKQLGKLGQRAAKFAPSSKKERVDSRRN